MPAAEAASPVSDIVPPSRCSGPALLRAGRQLARHRPTGPRRGGTPPLPWATRTAPPRPVLVTASACTRCSGAAHVAVASGRTSRAGALADSPSAPRRWTGDDAARGVAEDVGDPRPPGAGLGALPRNDDAGHRVDVIQDDPAVPSPSAARSWRWLLVDEFLIAVSVSGHCGAGDQLLPLLRGPAHRPPASHAGQARTCVRHLTRWAAWGARRSDAEAFARSRRTPAAVSAGAPHLPGLPTDNQSDRF